MITLQTERLVLRPFAEEDADLLYNLDSDPDVVRYVGGTLATKENCQEILKRLIDRQPLWKTYGTWVAELKSTGESIGWFTLKPIVQHNNDYEVGYRLLKKHWGQGYATEGSRMLVQYGLNELKLEKIVAFTHLDNKASQNVLRKSGLNLLGQIDNFFHPERQEKMFLFEIKN